MNSKNVIFTFHYTGEILIHSYSECALSNKVAQTSGTL